MEEKMCTKCGDLKPLDKFYKSSRNLNGYKGQCKDCQKKYFYSYTLKESTKTKRRAAARVRSRSKATWLIEIKEEVGCISCDENRGPCLDFHHEGHEEKSFDISQRLGSAKSVLVKEIKKCIVICANCHRVLHSREHNAGCE